jgi:predicted transcriptional regulator
MLKPKQILVELDAATAARLERAAPARSRRRSEFIRQAIRRALWELEERETRASYLRDPDRSEVAWPEPAWEPWTVAEPKRRVRRVKKR